MTVLLVILLAWVGTAHAALEVPLTVSEPAGVARQAAPVTSGLPLPAGTDLNGPWALFEGGREIPLQVTPRPGRTPWILLDFQLDLGSGKTKSVHLRAQKPTVQPAAASFTPPPTVVRVVDAATGQQWTGVPERETWEYRGPIRSVLRVDGRYGSVAGFGFTTRYTFYSGRRSVRIEHVLRNSLQNRERHLKLKSATLALGTGAQNTRVENPGEAAVVRGDVTVELLPTHQGKQGDGKKGRESADNGGYVLLDLTHFAATVVYDPGNEWKEAPPLMALAPARWYSDHGELTARRFGTLDDERETYRRWGWPGLPRPEPTAPLAPSGAVTLHRIDVHGESEADDLWQNLLMYLRTGQYGYFVRAGEWAAYYTREYPYRTDGYAYAGDGAGEANPVRRPPIETTGLTEADRRFLKSARNGKVDVRAWGACHFYGYGLLDWAAMTGQTAAVEAAVDLGEISLRVHGPRQPDARWLGHGRGIGRHLLLAVRLWEVTQDTRWKAHADHLLELILGAPTWKEVWGMYLPEKNPSRVPTPFHVALVHHALARYDEVFGHQEARRRVVRMAEFARKHALHPRWGFSAKAIYVDQPAPGLITYGSEHGHWTDTTAPLVNTAHTIAWVDVLVRGFRLTGDQTFLDRAILHWAQASRSRFKGTATGQTSSDDGRFANSHFGAVKHYFRMNGDLPYVHLLFADAARHGTNPAAASFRASTVQEEQEPAAKESRKAERDGDTAEPDAKALTKKERRKMRRELARAKEADEPVVKESRRAERDGGADEPDAKALSKKERRKAKRDGDQAKEASEPAAKESRAERESAAAEPDGKALTKKQRRKARRESDQAKEGNEPAAKEARIAKGGTAPSVAASQPQGAPERREAPAAAPPPPVAAGVTPAASTAPVRRFAALGDNTWLEANPSPRQAYASLVNRHLGPEACTRRITTAEPVVRSYTALLTDRKNLLFLFGGGHHSHPGNDVDIYRVDENRWEVQYEPECPVFGTEDARKIVGAGSGTQSLTPLGRPYTEHTYQQLAYDPARHRWVGVLSSGEATWAYDVAKKTWSVLAGPPVNTSSPEWRTSGGLVVYDPVLEKFIAIVRAPRGKDKGVHIFDPATNRWSFAAPFPNDIVLRGTQVLAAYNPHRREYYILNYGFSDKTNQTTLYRYSPEGHRWAVIGSLPPVLRQTSWMFDYDSLNRRVVVLIRNKAEEKDAKFGLWVWNPEDDRWEELPTPSTGPVGRSIIRPSFVYLPSHNVFAFVQGLKNYCGDRGGGGCGGPSKTWFYRYRNASETRPADAAHGRGR